LKVLAVTARWIYLVVFMGRRELTHESRSRKNENYTEKNILFATDFSSAADATAPFAIQVARSCGA
jgi:hypothetical protein